MASSTTSTSTMRSQISWPSREQIQSKVREAEHRFEGVDRQVRAYVKERPFAAVAGALAAGFVFGRILSRF